MSRHTQTTTGTRSFLRTLFVNDDENLSGPSLRLTLGAAALGMIVGVATATRPAESTEGAETVAADIAPTVTIEREDS